MGIKRGPLGRGLSALLPPEQENTVVSDQSTKSYMLCDVESIHPNPYQPRKDMDKEALAQLAVSIGEKGVLQPLVVRKANGGGDGYELVAGERRWRAAKLAGLDEVPVVIKDVSNEDQLEIALIENIQREDLNPVEEAESYYRLVSEFGLTQEEVAQRVGKERSTVANTLRIMQLPDYAKQDIMSGEITVGHARAILSLEESEARKFLRDEVIAKKLNVRQAEVLAKKLKNPKKNNRSKPSKVADKISESYCRALNNNLASFLGTKSRIIQNGSRGKVEIEYYSPEDLERLLNIIVKT